MDAKAEQQSLKDNPLPTTEIKNPLSYVFDLDAQIATLSETLADLTRLRTEALDYAVKNNIHEDDNCRIDEKYRKTRTLDIDKFKAVFPDAFQQCCDRERREIEEKIAGVGKKVLLTMADALVGKTALEAAPGVVLVKETIVYNVVRRGSLK